MNKKLFLILFLPSLIILFSGLVNISQVSREWDTELWGLIFILLGIIIISGVEVIIFFLFRKFLLKKLDVYKLASIICALTFIFLFIIGGFNDFFYELALLVKNISFCNIMTSHDTFSISRFITFEEKNSCIFRVASRTRNELLCENLPSGIYQYRCYAEVDVQKKLDICRKILDQKVKEQCFSDALDNANLLFPP